MNDDIIWVLKVMGFLMAGLIIGYGAQYDMQTKAVNKSASVYQPKTYNQVIILR
jgi:hypothetical protein